jgi:hypothetical protein
MIGYRELSDVRLLVELCGRPYIDVRASFNSLLPRGIEETTGVVLVDACLDRLTRMPWLHDKVEFEVVPTCLEFDFDAAFSERYSRLLAGDALSEFRTRLRDVTRGSLGGISGGSLVDAASALRRLALRQSVLRDSRPPAIAAFPRLLDECETLGTLPFACIARHAFIGEALLRSAVRRGALTWDRASELRRTCARFLRRSRRTASACAMGRYPRRASSLGTAICDRERTTSGARVIATRLGGRAAKARWCPGPRSMVTSRSTLARSVPLIGCSSKTDSMS